MTAEFTAEEEARLAPYFTNLDRSTFGLKLPQEVAGALFSRYSRSTKSLRRTFLDEFLGDPALGLSDLLSGQAEPAADSTALKKARAFYERVLVGYGDDSVAQLGGAHLACENISNVAAKLLEDARIGIAPLEKSTRYVRFDQKDAAGNYLFYREPKIMASRHRDAYLEVMNLLFDTYSRQMEPMLASIAKALPIEQLKVRDPSSGKSLSYTESQKDDRLRRWAETAYRATVRAHACDVLRSYLPAATLTNVGMFGVGQAFEYLISKFYSHELTEAKDLGGAMHGELNQLIPSFVKRAQLNEYLVGTTAVAKALVAKAVDAAPRDAKEPVTLIDYDAQAEEKTIPAILYSHARHPLMQLRGIAAKMSSEELAKILAEFFSKRRHRRDKLSRAFENVYYTFDILGNLGLYRDLHRHRILTQERQDFTTVHGYDTPPEIEEAGFKNEFDDCMKRAADLYERIYADLPAEAQYVVPFAYKIRWYMKMNLREALHMCELRTMPQGHPDYRFICQEMWRKIQEVHPTLAEAGKFIDWQKYRLGRLQSEMRTEFKKSRISKTELSCGLADSMTSEVIELADPSESSTGVRHKDFVAPPMSIENEPMIEPLLALAWRSWSAGGHPVVIDDAAMRANLEPAVRNGLLVEEETGLRFVSEPSMVQAAAQHILQTEGPLLTSTPKACFERLDEIFGKEIGKEHAVSGHVLALLHNGGQIDAYMWGRQAIEAGVRVFDVLHVMEGAVQRIENARAESIFTFFAGHYEKIKNDLAGGLLYPKLETWFARHSDVALDVKGLHEKHPNEPSASVYGCSLHGLILHDFKIGFPLAAEASRSVEPTIAGPAVNVLGLVDYTDPSRREALKETIQICTTIIKQRAHLLLGMAVRTLTRMVTLDENAIVALLEEAAETGVPEGLYSLSEFLWRNEKSLRDKDWFWPLVLHLASVKTEHKAILSNVDMMLDDWVVDVNQHARAIEFIDTWISKQSSAAFASGGIESFFPSTFHRLSEQPINLCRMLSKWLLEDDSRYPLVASKLVSYLRTSGLKILELNSAIIDNLTEKEIRFLVRRILGYVVGDEVQIPLIFSLVRTQNAKNRTFGYVAAVLQNQVGYDYPYQTIEYLKERAAAENEDEEIKALCKEIAADLQGRLDALNALPDLKEFRPSSVKMRRFLKERQLQMNTAIEEASKDSIWRQIATHIPLKAGRSTFQAIRGRYTNPTELKEMSHSIALPLSEISDPAGAERERRLFRKAKKDST